MIKFLTCNEFEKDFKSLSKRYASLEDDFLNTKKALEVCPVGAHTERINNVGKEIKLPVYKMRKFLCKSLQSMSKIRIIYIYDDAKQEIQFIQFLEIYTKSDKDNEDRARIEKYAKGKTCLSE